MNPEPHPVSSPSKAVDVMLRCPFCGGFPQVVRFFDGCYLPKCNGCEAIIHPAGGFTSREAAIAAWNRRAALSTIGESQ